MKKQKIESENNILLIADGCKGKKTNNDNI